MIDAGSSQNILPQRVMPQGRDLNKTDAADFAAALQRFVSEKGLEQRLIKGQVKSQMVYPRSYPEEGVRHLTHGESKATMTAIKNLVPEASEKEIRDLLARL